MTELPNTKNPKAALFEQFAQMANAFSSPQRLQILDALAQGNHSVEKLSHKMEMSMANTSRHLQALKQVGLVKLSKQGNQRYYELNGVLSLDILHRLRTTSETHSVKMDYLVNQYLKYTPEQGHVGFQHHAITIEALQQKQQQGIALLDIRPYCEYQQGHLTNATHIDPEQMEEQLTNWYTQFSGNTVAVYCRSAYCSFSNQALETLKKWPLQVHQLHAGWAEWRRQERPYQSKNQTQ